VSEPASSNADHCRELVKASDLDRYLSTLLAPKDRHRPLLAIYAFDAEISSLARQVSEPAIGEIRLQWWRDTIDVLYGESCNNHPIASELHLTVHQYDLPKHLFIKLIDAHQFDFYREPMASLDELLAYFTATSGAITDLVARVLIGDDALEIEHLFEKAGLAHGLGKMLAALPAQTAAGRCFLPVDLLQKQGLEVANVLASEDSSDMHLVTLRLRNMIPEQLISLRQEQGQLSKQVLPAFFPASLADLRFGKNMSSKRNLLNNSPQLSQLKMQWFLFKKSFFEQI